MSRTATLKKIISETSGLRERRTPCSRGGLSLAIFYLVGEVPGTRERQVGSNHRGPVKTLPFLFYG